MVGHNAALPFFQNLDIMAEGPMNSPALVSVDDGAAI